MNLQRLQAVLVGFGLGPDVVQYNGLPNEVFVIEPHAGVRRDLIWWNPSFAMTQ